MKVIAVGIPVLARDSDAVSLEVRATRAPMQSSHKGKTASASQINREHGFVKENMQNTCYVSSDVEQRTKSKGTCVLTLPSILRLSPLLNSLGKGFLAFRPLEGLRLEDATAAKAAVVTSSAASSSPLS